MRQILGCVLPTAFAIAASENPRCTKTLTICCAVSMRQLYANESFSQCANERFIDDLYSQMNNQTMNTQEKTISDAVDAAMKAFNGGAGISQAELSRRSGVPQPTISRTLKGSSIPETDTLTKLVAVLGTEKLGKVVASLLPPAGSFALAGNAEPANDLGGKIPLISWVRAGALCEATDNFHPGDAEEWLPCPIPFGEGAFALRVVGESMMPDYRDGEIIYVDPTRMANHGDDIVVRTPEGKTTFKRLQRTPDGTFLLAVNRDHPERIIRVPDDTHICGVVIGSWVDRRK